MSTTRVLSVAGSPAFGVCVLVAVAGAALAAAPASHNRLAAVVKVNSIPITSGQLDDEVARRLPVNAAHGGMVDDKQKDVVRKTALEELIVRELAYQRCRATGVKVSKAELDAAVGRVRSRYQTAKSFQEALRAEETDEQRLRVRLERDLLLKKIYKLEIDDKSAVSGAEALEYYNANQARYRMPEAVMLNSIVVKVAKGNEAAVKQKIEEAFQKLKAGAAFAEIAYRYSEDDYRMVGGEYGLLHRGQLAPDIEAAVFAAKPGVLTGPLLTGYGWQIFLVRSHQAARQLPYAEVKQKVIAMLRDKRIKENRTQFARSLRAAAAIEYVKP